jgi:hypothetical protein
LGGKSGGQNGRRRGLNHAAKAKVSENDLYVGRGAIAYAGVLQLDAAAAAFAVDEDVLRLDVAMDHPASC